MKKSAVLQFIVDEGIDTERDNLTKKVEVWKMTHLKISGEGFKGGTRNIAESRWGNDD